MAQPMNQATIPAAFSAAITSLRDDAAANPKSRSVNLEWIARFLSEHYGRSGRFDQQPITAAHPFPVGPSSPFDALVLMSAFVNLFEDHEEYRHEINPATADYRPWGMGRVWCQWENECCIHEMARIRNNGGHDARFQGESLFLRLSRTLNAKYGIGRSELSTKNNWYRTLRARSGIDERNNFRGAAGSTDARYSSSMSTSLQQ